MESSTFWNPLVPELVVSDFAKSLEFYTEVLGFSVRYRRESPGFCYLDQDGAQIMLQERHDSYWKTGEISYPSGRGINLQIELVNIGEVYKRLIAISYPLYGDVRISKYAAGEESVFQKEFLVQDPDGYLLRFSQPVDEK